MGIYLFIKYNNMKEIELNNSGYNKDTHIQINNILDFSFGEDNNDNKNEDIDMIDTESKNNINEEKIENKYKNKENIYFQFPKDEYNFCNNTLYCDNKQIINSSDITPFLISKKRKRKNENISNNSGFYNNNGLNTYKKSEPKSLKKIKDNQKLKKLLKNQFYCNLINLGNNSINNNIYEDTMNIDEDSI